jgi:hypothetical protein
MSSHSSTALQAQDEQPIQQLIEMFLSISWLRAHVTVMLLP